MNGVTGGRTVGAVLLALVMLAGCTSTAEEEKTILVTQESEQPEYDLAVVQRSDVERTQKIRCICQPASSQEAAFETGGGRISEVYVEKGDIVSAGELLAELDTATDREQLIQINYEIKRNELLLQQTYDDLQYDLDTKKLEYSHYNFTGVEQENILSRKLEREAELAETLKKIEDSYQDQIEDLVDAIEFDNMRLEELNISLSRFSLYAEISGTVSYVEDGLPGTAARAGEPVIIIQNEMGTVFTSDQTEYADYVPVGETVSMVISLGTMAGTYEVTRTDAGNAEELRFTVSDVNSKGSMEVGTTGIIRITLDRREQVLCVPANAIHEADQKSYAYVLDDQGFRTVQWVEIGLKGDSATEILAGLSEGDMVIVK